MISEAYILSNVGLAFFRKGKEWLAIDSDTANAPRSFNHLDRNKLVLGKSEVVHLRELTSLDELRIALKKNKAGQRALTLTLKLLDQRISSPGVKESIVTFLEERLAEDDVYAFVENRLLSIPPAPVFDAYTGLILSNPQEHPRVHQLLTEFQRLSSTIKIFDVAWNKVAVSTDHLSDQAAVEQARVTLDDNGFTKKLIASIQERDRQQWDNTIFKAAIVLQNQGVISGSSSLLFRDLRHELRRSSAIELDRDELPTITQETVEERDEISELISKYLAERIGQKKVRRHDKTGYTKRARKRRKHNNDYTDSDKVISSVNYLSEQIIKALRRGKARKARQQLLELIKSQVETSDPEEMCKSLCQLAKKVIDSKIAVEFADNLLNYAEYLNDQDPFIYGQRADLLKLQGRLDEALAEYKRVKILFKNNVIIQNGYADVLKLQGRLDEALVEYERIKVQFEDSEVAHCGYADVLKLQGRLDESLAEYGRIKARSEDNEVAHCGYADVLKLQGKLDESLAEYVRIKARFENDVVAQCGYADVLRLQGKLEKSLAEYGRIKAQFEHEVVPQNGYADVLKLQGKLDESLAEYDRIKMRFENDAVTQSGYADVLKMQGKLDESLAEYDRIKKVFKDNVVAQNSYADVLKLQGKLDESLAEYDRIKAQFKDDVVAQCGYADVLKLQGKLDESLAEYGRIKKVFKDSVVAQGGYANVLKLQGKLSQALREYSQIKYRFPHDVTAQSDYAHVLWLQGRLKEATQAYEIILRRHQSNSIAKHALATIYFKQNDLRFRDLIPKLTSLTSDNYYYWLHLKVLDLVHYEADWDTARDLLREALKVCQFDKTRRLYKRTLRYIALQQIELNQLFDELSTTTAPEPIDHLIDTHAYAVLGNRELAAASLEICKQHEEVTDIYITACLLSERFDINGLPRENWNEEKLDEEIRKQELMAIAAYYK